MDVAGLPLQQMGVCCEDGCQNDATWAWKTVKKTGQTHRVPNGHAQCHECWKAKDSAAAAKRRRIEREARGALPADELPADGELALASPSDVSAHHTVNRGAPSSCVVP